MVSSGTEATMSAIRLARGYTGRDNIVKFEGCYHGHSDSLLVKAGSGMLTLGEPNSAGVPSDFAKHTLTLPYNDIEALRHCFEQFGSKTGSDGLACVIIEPIAGNMNLIIPSSEFMQTLRDLCTQTGTVLIYDEVMTGFRVGLGGAQAHFGITPDLTCLGKIIGAGLPVGAFGGKHDIMSCIAPLGNVYQAGTLSGNPLAMRAGLAMFELLTQEGFYTQLSDKLDYLLTGITAAAKTQGIDIKTQHLGGMFGLYFTKGNISCFADIQRCDMAAFKQFFHGMLSRGIYLAPSAYEAGFISSQHSQDDLEATIAAASATFADMASLR